MRARGGERAVMIGGFADRRDGYWEGSVCGELRRRWPLDIRGHQRALTVPWLIAGRDKNVRNPTGETLQANNAN